MSLPSAFFGAVVLVVFSRCEAYNGFIPLRLDDRIPHHFDDVSINKQCGLPAPMMSRPRAIPTVTTPMQP